VEPGTSKPGPHSVQQLRLTAEAAEKAGDWETAFTAYCHLFVADRTAPDIREKLNTALRRSQQLRRHRDRQFEQFATSMTTTDAMKLFGEVLTKVPVMYAERDKATPQVLWEHGIDELHRALGDPVFRQAFLDGATADAVEGFRTSLRTSWIRQTVSNAHDAKLQLRKLIGAAQEKETFSVRVPSALVLEVVCGACNGLDEYTIFLNPSQLNPDSLSAVPDLTAQGVYLAFTEGEVMVAGVAPNSWAAFNTPLGKGDRIAQINGRTMAMATPAIAAEALRNPVNGFHDLVVHPAGQTGSASDTAIDVGLPVEVPTVYGDNLTTARDDVGYARVGSFTQTTPRELDDALNRMKARGVRAVVLDLRGNMGGSFLSGVETAKRLIPAGLIVTTQGQISKVDNQPFASDSGMSAHDLPVVVLVDAETASAAEVLAAALKDHNRATLIGMPTFGKGAIQYPVRLESLDQFDPSGKPKPRHAGGVRLTIAKLISPRGTPINGVGISPHVLEADRERQLQLGVAKAGELIPTRAMPGTPMMPLMPQLPIAP
jgi:C-terminal peptidase prc